MASYILDIFAQKKKRKKDSKKRKKKQICKVEHILEHLFHAVLQLDICFDIHEAHGKDPH